MCRELSSWLLAGMCLSMGGCFQATPEFTITPEVEMAMTNLIDAAIEANLNAELDVPIASDPQKASTSGAKSPITQKHNEPWTARIMALMGGLGFLYMVKYRVPPVRWMFDLVQGKKDCDAKKPAANGAQAGTTAATAATGSRPSVSRPTGPGGVART